MEKKWRIKNIAKLKSSKEKERRKIERKLKWNEEEWRRRSTGCSGFQENLLRRGID